MRIRQGNDFIFLWAIERNGLPEDLSNAVNVRLHFKNFDCVGNVQSFQIVDGNIVRVEVEPKWASRLGPYRLILSYEFEDFSLSDGDRKCVVDVLAFNIVPKTSEADDLTEMAKTTDIMIGLRGSSAYEVWLKDNPESTKEDYYNWLRQPATDAVSLIDDKIEHLDEVIDTSTANEAERVGAENIRISNETGRVNTEIQRVDNEDERLANEINREQAENLRAVAEGSRADAENIRVSNENTRELNETGRVNAENDRVNAESIRASNESTRLSNEVDRVNAESDRVVAEGLRQTNTAQAITDAENATENANTAAQNADDARLAIQDDLELKANHGYGVGETAKTLKEVDDEKAEHGYASIEVAKTLKQVEENASVKIKNEVVNGNFENGLIAPFRKTDGGGGASTFDINSSTPISGNYDARLTITTPTTSTGRPILDGLNGAANIGDKIYLHFYAKILSGTPTIYGIHNGTGTVTTYGGNVINGRNTRIIDVVGTGDTLGVIYFDSRSSVWAMQMDNFMRINLTETFGAGNEPTKEEIDLLISILGIDYFEGEITIPAQKVMQWQLKLIRKNKNAIIALGGTII